MTKELGATKLSMALAAIGMLPFAAGCGSPVVEGESAAVRQHLFGNVYQPDMSFPLDFVTATAALLVRDNLGNLVMNCSGTLVRPDRVLTAAHCVCGPIESVTFADSLAAGGAQYPVLGVAPASTHALEKLCNVDADYQQAVFSSPFDVAVLTVGPDPVTGQLPPTHPTTPVRPIDVYLSDPRLGEVVTVLSGEHRLAGFGRNAPVGFAGPGCIGCGVRRTGPLPRAELLGDWTCERRKFLFWELDKWKDDICWYNGTYLWKAPLFSTGLTQSGAAGGDSGSALFDISGVGTSTEWRPSTKPWVVGVTSWALNRPVTDQSVHWAPLNHLRSFLVEALALPFTQTVAQARLDTAIYARSARLNDRAYVVDEVNAGARVVAGVVSTGTDVHLEGSVVSESNVGIAARPFVDGDIIASDRITIGDGRVTVTGSIRPGEFQRLEPFELSVPWSAGTTYFKIPRPTTIGKLTPPSGIIDPGRHGTLQVEGGAMAYLRSGVYVFEQLQLESGSYLDIDTGAGPVWIYVVSSGASELILRGAVIGDPSAILIGVPRSPSLPLGQARMVRLGSTFRGTLVGPELYVVADMEGSTHLEGSFFVQSFELHQGRWLKHVPFAGPWVPTCPGGAFTGCT